MASPGQLESVDLRAIRFDRNGSFDPASGEFAYGVTTTITAFVDEERRRCVAQLDAKIEWEAEDGEAVAEPPFALEVSLEGQFAWHFPEADPADIQAWVRFNSEHLLWPYLRMHVQAITAAAGLPPLTIFTLMIPAPRMGHNEAELDPRALPGDDWVEG